MSGSVFHLNKQSIPNAGEEDVQEQFAPLIEPGEYEAHCVKYKEFRQYGNLPKLCLEWNFFLSGMEGVIIPQYFNMNHKKFKEASYYYWNWVIANNGTRPLRRTRTYMSPKVFENIIAIVHVDTVRRKFPDGSFMAENFNYSKVSYIKNLTQYNNTGGRR